MATRVPIDSHGSVGGREAFVRGSVAGRLRDGVSCGREIVPMGQKFTRRLFRHRSSGTSERVGAGELRVRCGQTSQ
jgi:hypothetical protein